ncbi:toprim domain-containing protein [Paracoccus sp. FO-3]|uniref:DUF7146 domain-containing protein n=1 Tax=Paracoccus sp. FO-3 TaxID=1335059 RepID=UPI00112B823A|nr:toprim domain-containing protein [Paracoccus sp. FO-3]
MGRETAADLAARLGRQAEAVCRHYLPAGRRSGRYWIVGDVHNNPGRSLFVRLTGPERGKGAAGHWQDPAAGTYGDLLDLIGERMGLARFRDIADEARSFLGQPHPEPVDLPASPASGQRSSNRVEAARRLFRMSRPIAGTLAETYLRHRGITAIGGLSSLRFHPRCYHRPEDGGPVEPRPALIASVTDLAGRQTGAHRTWLDPSGLDKADVVPPRRAMGDLLGHAVRFGESRDVLAAGEGIETVLSLREAIPDLPAAAALSAGHLAALLLPEQLRRLYILRDRDPAGDSALDRLASRAVEQGIEAWDLLPERGDFNDDLRRLGPELLRERLRGQLHPGDAGRFASG